LIAVDALSDPSLSIHPVRALQLTCDDWPWPFASQRRAEIDAYFARLKAAKPALWNGDVLLARRWEVSGDTLTARYFITDYASFLSWRDWGFPDPGVTNAFGMGALRSRDGAYLVGEMGGTTANAGVVYFPSGMLDRSDVRDGRIDMPSNVTREVCEETGLAPSEYQADAIWHVVPDGGRLAMIRRLDSPSSANELKARIDSFITAQAEPELKTVHAIRQANDISHAMPSFVRAYLHAAFNSFPSGAASS
jgi:hypothetical protein